MVIWVLAGVRAHGTWFVETETGVAVSTLNDVRIPNEDGTRLSLTHDLDPDPAWCFRLRVGKTLADRHTLLVLAAPLTLHAEGAFDHDVTYDGQMFPAGQPVRATYRFDSYRLTYRYDFPLDRIELGVGVSAKIRDAAIALDGERYAEYTNTGFVPLVNFGLFWPFTKAAGLLLEGDALAAPQGRAEDVLLAVTADFSESVRFRAGYRVLEGGADTDEVYTFALIHYATIGLTARF